MKKVLIITYYWPPSGGSGVQRWLKFVKYLPENGIQPIILTVNPDFASYPAIDNSLLGDVSPDLKVVRTKAKNILSTYKKVSGNEAPHSGFANQKKSGLLNKMFRFIRGNFFIPDARIGWNKFALEEARRIIEQEGIDTVVTTSPPHSTQLIGLQLKQEFDLKWIADLRDPWTEIFYNDELYRTKLAISKDRKYEQNVLNSADSVVVVSDAIKRSFGKNNKAVLDKITVIPNGFDDTDFSNLVKKGSDRKVISYIGNLGPQYPIETFLEAFKKFSKENTSWYLRFIGNVHPGIELLIQKLNLSDKIEFISYVPHSEAVHHMINSDCLLMIIPDIAENKGILTGKLFEYIATGNAIINIGPTDGDAANILAEFNKTTTVEKNDLIGMLNFLNNLSHLTETEDYQSRMKYSRSNLTKQIAELIVS